MLNSSRCLAALVLAGLVGFSSNASALRPSLGDAVAREEAATKPLDLPDAPEGTLLAQGAASGQDANPATTASISGTVYDSSGALVPGARIALTAIDGGNPRTVVSSSGGEFNFAGLPAGTYRLVVASPGMGSYTSQDIAVNAGERRQVERIILKVATDRADVRVVVTQQELATEQVKVAEQQRVFGVLPNFYSSYEPNPVPLGARQKFGLAFRSTTDPVSFLTAGISAGIGQATDLYHGYGQGAEGYGKRYGAAYGDDIIDRMLGSALLPTLFRQDPRYFYKGTGTTKSRVLYALKSTIVCKGDNGKWQFNYSHLIGNFAAAGVSNLYYPAADRGAGLTIRNGLVDTAGNAAANVIRELLLKRLTPKAQDAKRNTPAP